MNSYVIGKGVTLQYGVRSPHSWVIAETALQSVGAAVGKRFESRG